MFACLSRPRWHLIRCLLVAVCALISCATQAACFAGLDPRLQEFESLMRTKPAAVPQRLGPMLAQGSSPDDAYRAAAYALLAESYSVQERNDEAHKAVESGLDLVGDVTSPIYLNLLYVDTQRPLEEAEIDAGIERAEAVLERQAKDSPGEACALITLGTLEYVANRTDRASIHLTRAYRMSTGDDRMRQRMVAAGTLSLVMQALRDFTTAVELSQEMIKWQAKHGSRAELSTAYYMHGHILAELGNALAARDALERSRAIGVELNDGPAAAYADQLLCTVGIDLGDLKSARRACASALRFFSGAQANEPRKQALTALAEIDLQQNEPARALEKLNEVLDADGRDLPPFRLEEIYSMRARAHRQLGRPANALDDYENYMRRFKANKEDERAREAAAMRARFETDREVERNAFLNRELAIQGERLTAQSARLYWMFIAAAVCVTGMILLTILALANRKKKRMLVRLAQEDALTGLPNRRYGFERAEKALAAARDRRLPVTIGVLDLDHFKRINDRYGHAAGDYVLKEFARIARECVRRSDLLARWGGEEFLLVLPDTPLDEALHIAERVRLAAARIKGGPLPQEFTASLSAGLATSDGHTGSLDEVIAEADAALYEAKNRGRNRVQIAQTSYDASPQGVRRTLKISGVDMQTGRFIIKPADSHSRAVGS